MSRKNLLINISLSIFSIYIPLFFYSIYDYLLSDGTATEIEKKRIIREDIPQKINALKEGYIPRIFPVNLWGNDENPVVYPVGSLPNTKTYLCNEGYGLIRYESDRFGLRNKDQKWKIANKKSNIFVLGDSFIQGQCVLEKDTITSNIEKSTKINTINLGSGGNGPYQYLALLRSMVKPIIENSNNQQIVLIVFYANDNEAFNSRNEKLLNLANPIIDFSTKEGISPTDFYIKEINNFIKKNYLEDRKEIILKLNNWENNNFKESPFYYLSTLYPVRRDAKRFLINLSNLKTKEKSERSLPSEKTIMLLSKICKKNCNPLIAYIPNSSFWNPDPRSEQYKLNLENMAIKMGIEFVDGEKEINKNNREDYSPSGGHLSINGYKKVSNLISDFIKRNYKY